jgi:hypothetical protein
MFFTKSFVNFNNYYNYNNNNNRIVKNNAIKQKGKYINGDNKSVFQKHPKIYVALDDISDSLETAKKLRESDKKDFFESQFMDYENIKKYYTTVVELEKVYYESNNKRLKMLFDMYHYIYMFFLHIVIFCNRIFSIISIK